MKKSVDLDAILNVKKAYDKKIYALRKSLERNRFLLKKLDAVGLTSSEKEAQEVFGLIAKFSKKSHLIAVASGADRLFKQLKSMLSELIDNFSKWADEIVDQLVNFCREKRTDDQKVLRRMFDSVLNNAQYNAIIYKSFGHPMFLELRH
jgi:hypothetical protein